MILTRRSKRTWHAMTSLAGVFIVAYFLYHTVQGDHGWLAMIRLQNEVNVAQESLSQLQREHQDLDHRVQLMRPDHLDPDLLDEESRKTLNYSKPGDIVILMNPDGKPVTASNSQKSQ